MIHVLLSFRPVEVRYELEAMPQNMPIWDYDDGETVGVLLRPMDGFEISSDPAIVPADEVWPEPPWLTPRGDAVETAWPRSDKRWLNEFAALRRDEDIARFASKYGWLGRPVSRHGATEPTTFWRSEAAALADLLGTVDDARLLDQSDARLLDRNDGQSERARVLRHFRETRGLHEKSRDAWRRRRSDGWHRSGDGDVTGIAFTYGVNGSASFRVPKGGPVPASPLSSATPQQLAVLARNAVGAVAQSVIQRETAGVITIGDAIRVVPRSQLGALYLTLARELTNRRKARACPVCRESFIPKRRDQWYCNRNGIGCHQKANRERRASERALRANA